MRAGARSVFAWRNWTKPTAKDFAALIVLTGPLFLGLGIALLALTPAGSDQHDAIQFGLGLGAAGAALSVLRAAGWGVLRRGDVRWSRRQPSIDGAGGRGGP